MYYFIPILIFDEAFVDLSIGRLPILWALGRLSGIPHKSPLSGRLYWALKNLIFSNVSPTKGLKKFIHQAERCLFLTTIGYSVERFLVFQFIFLPIKSPRKVLLSVYMYFSRLYLLRSVGIELWGKRA